MMQQIEEFGRYIEITGYRAVAFATAEAFLKANRKQNQTGVAVQFFDASLVATSEHLYFAALNALQAIRGKTNISKSLAVEAMLYASAERQIQRAIEHIGIKEGCTDLAVLLIGDDPLKLYEALGELTAQLGIAPDESVLQLTAGKQQKIRISFQISEEELKTIAKGNVEEALVALIVERMALLSTQV